MHLTLAFARRAHECCEWRSRAEASRSRAGHSSPPLGRTTPLLGIEFVPNSALIFYTACSMTARLAQLEKLLAAEPGDPFTLYAIAQEHAKANDAAQAVDFFDRCLAADPNYLYAYFHKAKVQSEAGDTPAALATLRAAIPRARAASDAKALSELQSLLDELE